MARKVRSHRCVEWPFLCSVESAPERARHLVTQAMTLTKAHDADIERIGFVTTGSRRNRLLARAFECGLCSVQY